LYPKTEGKVRKSIIAKLVTIGAAASLSVTATAQTAAECISKENANSLVTALLPGMILRFSAECAPLLPANASLTITGPSVAAANKDKAIAARPAAYDAVKQIAGKDFPSEMTMEVAFPFVDAMLASQMSKLKSKDNCIIANNVWGSLQHLPLEHWGGFVAAVVSATGIDPKNPSQGKSRQGLSSAPKKFPICPYVSAENQPIAPAEQTQKN
jgi:hypothetical protein